LILSNALALFRHASPIRACSMLPAFSPLLVFLLVTEMKKPAEEQVQGGLSR
jgi:hypothetical protein